MTWPMGPWLAPADGLDVSAVPEAVGEAGGPPQATSAIGSSQASSSRLR